MRNIIVILFAVLVLPAQAEEIRYMDREEYTCEKEEKYFSSWQRLAGKPNVKRIAKNKATIIDFEASDSRTLRGIYLSADNSVRGAVLVLPGNAWLADDFLSFASTFTSNGLDVYVFDYRGYGLSKNGNATFKAIIEDYREIGRWLEKKSYENIYLYAFSFGGVVATNAFSENSPFKQVVLDSVPSRPSKLIGIKCSVSYSPLDKVSSPCNEITFMHGTSDWVIGRGSTQELIDTIDNCGGKLDIDKWRGHPFQLEWSSTSRARIKDVITHFGIELEEKTKHDTGSVLDISDVD